MSEIVRRVIEAPDGGVTFHAQQDVSEILAWNQTLANADRPSSRLHHSGMERWYRVASIPNLLIERWMLEGINFYREDGWKKVKAMLNTLEYGKLRTAPGRI